MEPNRLEQEFRDKLEQRTIEPSKMAWDRLDAMLSVGEEKEEQKVIAIKPDRKWMYVAAVFVAFLLAGILLNQEKENGSGTINKGSGIVTKEQPAKKENTTSPAQTEEHNPTEDISAPQNALNAVAATETIKKPSKNTVHQKQNKSNASGNIKEKSSVVPSHNGSIAVVSNEEPKEGITPNANEADNLLAASGGDIHKKKRSVKVDANSLLSSVEGELDDNFRDKALQGVIKNFNAVKSSVANRNYQ
ncbi:hypothetical protein HYN59_07100 [Flavobacterium album]|uniref:Uncharacterized protein n=1 Tax=Flavobacterium album TaxID=2175091 RepID=A0A2S1QWX7_9FLAO|nr:hypothetical protein [Flavobacterium album]AWH84905.1 hypothetical protein HYN59_07100 [Flavobacterium album]